MVERSERAADLDAKRQRLLSALLAEQGLSPGTAPILPLSRERATFPLSFAQERLWVTMQLDPANTGYNLRTALLLSGALSVPVLRRTMAEVVRRHRTLRTTYRLVAGRPVQIVAPAAPFPVPVVDLAALPEDRIAAETRRLSAAARARPFDLARGPVLRLLLLRRAAREHAVVVTVHHIASDGWSSGVLIRELAALYDAFRAGRPSPLPELPIQYVDFAEWQRHRLGEGAVASALVFWREQLAGVPVLDLPADRPRPSVASEAGGAAGVALPDPLLRQRAAALGREHKATLFMVVAALFQAFLSRLSGQTDFAVGTPVANRHRTETEGLIGFFVNTLVLRADLAGDPTVGALVARAQQVASQAFAHGQLPFSRVVEALNPERSVAHTPLFQVLFSYGNLATTELAIPGLAFRPLQEPKEVSLFDLGLTWVETERGFDVALEYRSDLFDRTTVQRMLGQLVVLFENALAAPGLRLSRLPLLSEPERFQLLAEWAATAATPERLETLPALFSAWARAEPERPALVAGEARLSYGALAGRANRIARRLLRLGVGPEVRVAIRLPRTADLVAAILGVLEAGGAYVPIDPAYPEARQAFLMADSGAVVVISEAPLPGGGSVPLLRPEEAADESAEPLPPPRLDLLSLAYVIYTSGSTGTPKGVAITHGSAAARIAWAVQELDAATLSGVLASTSVCFDLSLFELFAPLSSGGRVILADHALALTPLPAAAEVTLVNTVPSAMAELLRGGSLPRALRAVNLAGEPVPPPLVAALLAALPDVRVQNLYGPSEDTTYSTASLLDGSGMVPIGRPLPGTRAYALDAAGELAPAGVPGELYLGGVGLARGYLDRPELTAGRFLPDPFGSEPGGRLYRTGDLVRHRGDGALLFLRRVDQQVKVRGFRIELGEVEAALLGQPGVREAAAGVREDVPGDCRLVAYVVLEEGSDGVVAAAGAGVLRDRLRRSLPEALVPSAVQEVAALPRNANGKLDRKALFQSGEAPGGMAGRGPFSPPLTPTEEILAGIWAEVLGPQVARVSRDDGFFALGGHSLLAIQVGYRVREVFGVDLALGRLFGSATLADLARDVDLARQGGAERAATPIARAPRGAPLPASYYQQWFWDLQGGTAVSAFFNIPMALRLVGALDLRLLERALGEVVRRHEALRTLFRWRDGVLMQVIVPPGPWRLPLIDLCGLPADRQAARAEELAAEDARHLFDVTRGPLFTACVLVLSPADHALLVNVHHIVADGWSLSVLQGEVMALYRALAAGEESPLPELPLQYADFAAWQRATLAGDELERQLAWWRQQLAGRPPVPAIPADLPRPASFSAGTWRSSSVLEGAAARRLRDLARASGCTIPMVLLAAAYALVHRYTGCDDLVIGSIFSARDRPQLVSVFGFFVNTVPLRVDLSGDPTFRELLGRVRDASLAAYSHQDLPFPQLLAGLFPGRKLKRTLLSRVLFNMLSFAGAPSFGAPPADEPGPSITRFGEIEEPAKNDLVIDGREGDDFVEIAVLLPSELFFPDSAGAIRRDLESLLSQAAAEPETRLGGLLSEARYKPALGALPPRPGEGG